MQFLLCFQVPLRFLLLLDLLLESLQLFLDLLDLLLRLESVLLDLELSFSDSLNVNHRTAVVRGISSGGGNEDCIDVRILLVQRFASLRHGFLGCVKSLLGILESLEFLILLALLSTLINCAMSLLLNQRKVK